MLTHRRRPAVNQRWKRKNPHCGVWDIVAGAGLIWLLRLCGLSPLLSAPVVILLVVLHREGFF